MRKRDARAAGTPSDGADDGLQRRLGELFETLLCDIVRLGAGEVAEMPYAHERVRRALVQCFAPLRAVNIVAVTEFSEPVALGVAYVASGEGKTTWVEIETEEWTTLEAVNGRWTRPLPCRQRRLVAEVDAECTRVLQLGRGAA